MSEPDKILLPEPVRAAAQQAMNQLDDELDEIYRAERRIIGNLQNQVDQSSIGNDPSRSPLTKLIHAVEGSNFLDMGHRLDSVIATIQQNQQSVALLHAAHQGFSSHDNAVEGLEILLKKYGDARRNDPVSTFVQEHRQALESALAASREAGGKTSFEKFRSRPQSR